MDLPLQDVGLAVKRLQWRHHREADRRLAPLGLSLVQWDVLRHLHAHPEASVHDLAVLTFQTDQSMGELARRMVDRGLLERSAGPGRKVQHRLTDAGDRVRTEGAAVVDGVLAGTLGRLSPSERATLHSLLLQAAEEAAGDGSRGVGAGPQEQQASAPSGVSAAIVASAFTGPARASQHRA